MQGVRITDTSPFSNNSNIESVDLENKEVLITHAVGKETDPIAWRSHALKYDYLVFFEICFDGMDRSIRFFS